MQAMTLPLGLVLDVESIAKKCKLSISRVAVRPSLHDKLTLMQAESVMSNRLADAQSLYLRKHAENPIDWWSWCDEALNKADAEDKPIFLSIGYSSCHWCTVMEGEAFSDPAIADYINANFVPIKVDREERPDLDSIYMQALQAMTGQGGWPLNIFLTPDRRIPFYGGTYFPIEPRYGRPGFLDILQALRRFYDREKEKLQSFTTEMVEILQQSVQIPATDNPLSEELWLGGIETASGVTSARGQAPCFPMMPYADAALRGIRFEYNSRYGRSQVCTQRGLDLALGGIYDHVGGGFHRYTVDATWTVPHFEKMLYDNGQILEYLANLWSSGLQEPSLKRAIAGTAGWLRREMMAPEGYFYAAQDADNFVDPTHAEPEEGAFYVWSYRELESILSPGELERLKGEFNLSVEGNFEGSNVLQRKNTGTLAEEVEAIVDKLFNLRYGSPRQEMTTFAPARNNREAKTKTWPGRIPPVTDTKAIVAWNSLAISGLARAYAVFGDETYWNDASRAAHFILERQWVNERLYRLNYDGEATLVARAEDYALFIKALLDLQACQPQESQWLDKATQLQTEFDRYFWDAESGGYFNTASDASDDLLVRERSYIDNATPSPNGVAIANLVRLYLLLENPDYLQRAEMALKAFSAIMEQSPQACPSLFVALDWYHHGTLVKGKAELLQALRGQFYPGCAYRVEEDLPENVVGMVCQGLSCLEPARSLEQFFHQLQGHRVQLQEES